MTLKTLFASAALCALGACTATLQTTSGADYLAGYDASHEIANGTATDVDEDVRRIAAIEPTLAFPARIGLARIERGSLTALPADEARIWQDMVDALGEDYGAMVPVSPLIASMVRPDKDADRSRHWRDPTNAIADIRRGAARQHLDYVLAYEVGTSSREKANAIALADLTVIGMFVLPSRSVEVEASASGILLDVRNGYPYATVTAHAEKNGLARAVSEYSRTRELADTAEELAVLELSDDVKNAMEDLARASVKQKAPTDAALPEKSSTAWWQD